MPVDTTAPRRRIAAIAILVLSCGALLATSYSPIQAALSDSHTTSATLTEANPRVAGSVRLTLTPEALPVVEPPLARVTGGIRITQPHGQDEEVLVSVRAEGVEIAPRQDAYGDLEIPIEQLCRVAEPCVRELEITMDWVRPGPQPLEASVTLELEIVHHEVEVLPDGAVADLEQSAPMTPTAPGPSVRAETEAEQLVLDRDQWAVARHVMLTASEAARTGRIVAFVERVIGQAPEPRVVYTIVPDARPGDVRTDAEPFEPFADCPAAGDCERGFTIRFELGAFEPDTVATVRWSIGARATFTDADAPPAGASVTAVVDGAAEATSDLPAVRATASGSVPAPDPDAADRPTLRRTVLLRMTANSAALPAGSFGSLPPSGLALVTVRGAGEAAVSVALVEAAQPWDPRHSAKLRPDDPEATVLLNPFRSCAPGRSCTVTLRLTFDEASPAEAGEPIPFEWELDVTLVYPGPDAPRPAAAIEIAEVAEVD